MTLPVSFKRNIKGAKKSTLECLKGLLEEFRKTTNMRNKAFNLECLARSTLSLSKN
jgi:hypothetical protein